MALFDRCIVFMKVYIRASLLAEYLAELNTHASGLNRCSNIYKMRSPRGEKVHGTGERCITANGFEAHLEQRSDAAKPASKTTVF